MENKTIQKMLDRHRQLAEKNFDNYQETGESRYLRNYEKEDELAEALQIALDSSAEHEELVSLRSALGRWKYSIILNKSLLKMGMRDENKFRQDSENIFAEIEMLG